MFQFHTGSIKRLRRTTKRNFFVCFNSILVRLKATAPGVAVRFCGGFNSILVRLKGETGRLESRIRYSFQFHTGSIKSPLRERVKMLNALCFNSILVRLKAHYSAIKILDLSGFQFHTGSIKRTASTFGGIPFPGFNSILVRLKASDPHS